MIEFKNNLCHYDFYLLNHYNNRKLDPHLKQEKK